MKFSRGNIQCEYCGAVMKPEARYLALHYSGSKSCFKKRVNRGSIMYYMGWMPFLPELTHIYRQDEKKGKGMPHYHYTVCISEAEYGTVVPVSKAVTVSDARGFVKYVINKSTNKLGSTILRSYEVKNNSPDKLLPCALCKNDIEKGSYAMTCGYSQFGLNNLTMHRECYHATMLVTAPSSKPLRGITVVDD